MVYFLINDYILWSEEIDEVLSLTERAPFEIAEKYRASPSFVPDRFVMKG